MISKQSQQKIYHSFISQFLFAAFKLIFAYDCDNSAGHCALSVLVIVAVRAYDLLHV